METINNYKPYSQEAEQAVIGGILDDNAIFADVVDLLTADDFHLYDHREIYSAISFAAENIGNKTAVINDYKAQTMNVSTVWKNGEKASYM